MKILNFEQRSPEWHEARRGKITGSKLKDIVSTGTVAKDAILEALAKKLIPHKKTETIANLLNLLPEEDREKLERSIPKKLGFYKLLAEKIAYEAGDQKPIDRGTDLEEEALAEIAKYLGEEIEQVGMCVHEIHPEITVSPDGLIKNKKHKKYFEAVEIKCRNTDSHLQAIVEKKIPDEYRFQILQYFIVIDTLEVLHFCFYDPRVPGHELFIIEVTRDEVRDDVERYEQYQIKTIEELNQLAEELTF